MLSKAVDLRKLALGAAAVVATAGLTGSVGAPAVAAPSVPRCQVHTIGPNFDSARGTVTGAHLRVCDPDIIVDLPVAISRNGRVVAEGEGIAVYQCRGTAVGEFRVNASPPRSFPCG